MFVAEFVCSNCFNNTDAAIVERGIFDGFTFECMHCKAKNTVKIVVEGKHEKSQRSKTVVVSLNSEE